MKKLILLSLLFVGFIGLNNATAQKKEKKKDNIDPIGIECDQIFVSVSGAGKIKFSEPVNLYSVGLVDKLTNEVVKEISFYKNGSLSVFKTDRILHEFVEGLDILVEFELIEDEFPVIALAVSEPCSRQIVIGQK